MIVIAHRLSTVENANRIIVINKGEVVEQGSHGDLLKKGGMYAMLVKKQMVAEEELGSEGKKQATSHVAVPGIQTDSDSKSHSNVIDPPPEHSNTS